MMLGSCRRKAAQCGGKVQADLVLHLDLIDSGKLEFDRILSRHNVGSAV